LAESIGCNLEYFDSDCKDPALLLYLRLIRAKMARLRFRTLLSSSISIAILLAVERFLFLSLLAPKSLFYAVALLSEEVVSIIGGNKQCG
jgi:hypothetical protein